MNEIEFTFRQFLKYVFSCWRVFTFLFNFFPSPLSVTKKNIETLVVFELKSICVKRKSPTRISFLFIYLFFFGWNKLPKLELSLANSCALPNYIFSQ